MIGNDWGLIDWKSMHCCVSRDNQRDEWDEEVDDKEVENFDEGVLVAWHSRTNVHLKYKNYLFYIQNTKFVFE